MRELHIGAIWHRPATALAKRLLHGFARRKGPNAALSASAPKQERGARKGRPHKDHGRTAVMDAPLSFTRVVGPRVAGGDAERISGNVLAASVIDTLEVAVDRVAYDR